MKIAVVSPYPPSKGTLNEYAFHLIESMRLKEEVEEIIILTDRIEDEYEVDKRVGSCKITVIPCWNFNSYTTVFSIIKQIKKVKADIALYNIQFLSFGDKKVAGALGLLMPLLTKLTGVPAVTLLHNITETVDYKSAGITENKVLQWIYNKIGTLLTKLLLQSNLLAVTMPKYVRILEKKYGAKNVALIPHGSFEVPELPLVARPKKKQIMTFGKFGTYKKVEEMIEAVEIVRKRTGEELEIVIAGTDNPNVRGYLANVKEQYKHVSDLRFTGYVEEEDVPFIFSQSSVVVFPYTSTTGSSGVLHQAGSFAKAVVLPNIGDLKELIEEEGYRGEYFQPSDIASLADAIEKLVLDSNYRYEMGQTNFAAASSLPMSDIAEWYLLHFMNIAGVTTKSVNKTAHKRDRQAIPVNSELALKPVKF